MGVVMENKCNICKETKEDTEFYKNASKRKGINSECKVCVRVSRKKYYENNKKKLLARSAKWVKDSPDLIQKALGYLQDAI